MIGQHKSGKTFDDVNGFTKTFDRFECIPKNLGDPFKNLKEIKINRDVFPKLKRSDFQSFGSRLKKLYLDLNYIEVIPADLFEDMVNLEKIDLKINEIRYVGKGAFDKLTKLTSLNFLTNPCFSGNAENRADVIILTKKIQENCTDEEAFKRYQNRINSDFPKIIIYISVAVLLIFVIFIAICACKK